MTQPIVGVRLKRWVIVSALMSLSCTQHVSARERESGGHERTGTFFCVITTAVSFPRTAIDVCPEPEMALNAYSAERAQP